MKLMTALSAAIAALIVSGCATKISESEEDLTDSKQPFGQFQYYAIKPVAPAAGKKVHGKWIAAIQRNLDQCMLEVFKNIQPFDEAAVAVHPGALVIEPVIVDLKAITPVRRIFAGPFPGSSAALMQVRFTDYSTNEVIANPTFYSRGDAWGGTFTFGTTDALMMVRLATEACDYSRRNF